MTQSNTVWLQLRPYLAAFHTHARLWVIPTIALTVASVFYALSMPTHWRASQTIRLRGDSTDGQGKFDSIDEMKLYQEKILEVAKSRVVVEAVLSKLGPPATHDPSIPWPTADAVSDMQGSILITPPKGLEFGTTDVFHLSVLGKTQENALARCRAVFSELVKNLGDLRTASAESLISELEKSQALAEDGLEKATLNLEKLEREVGPDLGELRLLTEHGSGDSNLRRTHSDITQSLRDAENERVSMQQLKDLLVKSLEDSTTLLATPGRLLDSQPGLKSLKDGLSNARLELSKLRGIMSESHPKLQQAIRAEQEIRRQLEDEVATSLRGIEADLAANAAQISAMTERQHDIQVRLDKLASLRARYNNLVADVHQRTQTLDSYKQQLAIARGAKNSATSSQLIPFGEPTVGDRPAGPSKKMVVLGGMASGLAMGAGLVFLCMPIGPSGRTRRWSDYLNMGRRATDQLFGRRASDPQQSQTSARSTDVVGVSVRANDITQNYLSQPVIGGRRNGDLPALPPKAPEPSYPQVDRRSGTGRRAADQSEMLP